MSQIVNKLKSGHWPLTLSTSVISIINMLLPMALVRMLTVSDIGVYRIFALYLMTMFAVSFVPGLVSGLPFWTKAGIQENHLVVQKAWSWNLLLSLLWLLVGLASLPFFSQKSDWTKTHSLLLVLSIFPSVAGVFVENLFTSLGYLKKAVVFNSIFELLRVTLVLGTAYWTKALIPTLTVLILVLYAKFLVGAYLAHRAKLISLQWTLFPSGEIFRYAGPVSASGVFVTLVAYADKLLLSGLLTPENFAFYSVGCLAIPPLSMLEQSVNRVLIPDLSKNFANNNNSLAQKNFTKACSELSLILLPASFGLFIFAEPIIELLFTEKYTSAANYLQLYAMQYILLILPYDSVQRAKGMSRWIFWNSACTGLFSLLSVGLGAWYAGALGALIGFLIGNLVMRLSSFVSILQCTQWPIGSFIPLFAIVRRLSLCALLAGICIHAQSFFDSKWLWFVVCGAMFTALYFILELTIGSSDTLKEKFQNRNFLKRLRFLP